MSGSAVDARTVDCFIVGAPKCGTTMLFEHLNMHSNCVFPQKELHFFNTDLPTRRWAGLSEYLAAFADAPEGAVLGDASVWYLYSRDALTGIRAHNPDARIVVMLRNPVRAAEALHGQLLLDGRETLHDFEAAWRAIPQRQETEGPIARQLEYDRVYEYAPQLERLYAAFPAEQVRVLVLEEFQRAPREAFASLLGFLGAEGAAPESFARVNPSKRVRSRALHYAVYRAPRALGPLYGAAKRAANALGWRPGAGLMRLHVDRNVIEAARPPVPAHLVDEMARTFLPDIARVEEILGRRMDAWHEALEGRDGA